MKFELSANKFQQNQVFATESLSATRFLDVNRTGSSTSTITIRLFDAVAWTVLDTFTANTAEGLPVIASARPTLSKIDSTSFILTVPSETSNTIHIAKFSTASDTISRVGAYHKIADTAGDADRNIRTGTREIRAIPGPDADRVIGTVYAKNNTVTSTFGEIWVNTSAFSADWNTMTYNNEFQHTPSGHSSTDDFDSMSDNSQIDAGPLPYVRDDTKTYFGMVFEHISSPTDPMLIYKFNGASSPITCEHVENATPYRYAWRDDPHWFVTNGQLCAFYHEDAVAGGQDSLKIFTVSWSGSAWQDSGEQEFLIGEYIGLKWWGHLPNPDTNRHFIMENNPSNGADACRMWEFNVTNPLSWVKVSRSGANAEPYESGDTQAQPELTVGWHNVGDGVWHLAYQVIATAGSDDFYATLNGTQPDTLMTDAYRLSKMSAWQHTRMWDA